MKHKNLVGKIAAIASAVTLFALSFAIVPTLLAFAQETSDIETVEGNTVIKTENVSATPNLNSISKEQAIQKALTALKTAGFDTVELERQPIETRYISETPPANVPIWAVIFRDDKEGYAEVFDPVDDDSKDKLAAIGEIEPFTNEEGQSGLRAYYQYTRYTLVEINAFTGEYVQHGGTIVEFGEALNLDKVHFSPTTEEAWAQVLQEQAELQRKLDNK
jgi:hypothetical protein